MSDKQFDEREWGRRLEAGKESDPELLLAGQLRYFRPEPRPLPPHFKRELRGRLLQQYGERSAAGRLVEWGGSLAAGAVLALAVMVVWVWLAGPDQRWGAATESGTNPETNAAGSLPVDLALSGTAAETTRLQLEPAALEEEGTAAGWQLLALRQRPYRGNADLIQVEATLAWNLAAPPREVSFGLVHPEQGAEAGAAGMVVLSTAVITTTTGSFELSAVVDPLEVWQQLGNLEPLLAITTAQTLDGLGTLAETVAFAAEPLSLLTPGRDRLWLISASPEPGSPLAGQTPFRVEIGYRLVSAPTADVRLHLVHPEWESAGGDGRLPINGAGDVAAVTYGEGTLTFDFVTEHHDYLRQVIGDRTTLMAHMTTGGGSGVLDMLTLRNFSEAQWPIATPGPALPDRLWFTLVSPESGGTVAEGTPLEFKIGYELHSAATGTISVFLAHPDRERFQGYARTTWLESRQVGAGEGQLSFTTTFTELPYHQAVIGEDATVMAVLSTASDEGEYLPLVTATHEETLWRLGATVIGIPRVAWMEVTMLAESAGAVRLELLDFAYSSDRAQGLAPITVTAELVYGLPHRIADEASLLAFVMPSGGGASIAAGGGIVAAGEGRVILTFSFNPWRDLGRRLRHNVGYELMFMLNTVDEAGTITTRAQVLPDIPPPIFIFEP
jgi:hypothetical protein